MKLVPKKPEYYGKLLWAAVRYVIVVGIGFMIIYPLLHKVSVCFMSYADLRDPTVKLIPKSFGFEIFTYVYTRMHYWRTFAVTLGLSVLAAAAQLIVSTMAGYGLARFKFRGKGLLFALIILILLVPPSTILTPLYVRFNYFNLFGIRFSLIDTFWPFVLTSVGGLGLKNGLYIYMMRQFFRGLPKELEESAYMDGAGPYKAFLYIMLPNANNMMLTVFILSFTWQWTDSSITPMFLPNLKVFANIVSSVAKDYAAGRVVMAINSIMGLLIMFPLVLIYSFLQRRIIEGVESSGIVG